MTLKYQQQFKILYTTNSPVKLKFEVKKIETELIFLCGLLQTHLYHIKKVSSFWGPGIFSASDLWRPLLKNTFLLIFQ